MSLRQFGFAFDRWLHSKLTLVIKLDGFVTDSDGEVRAAAEFP